MKDLIGKKLSIDKSKWQPVKLGDVVTEPKESAKNFKDEGIAHVVGLEHIDSECVHLRRSASIKESTTFTKKFSVDDVLFGRRRAYLKKAAQAKFSGICSGDITVMRAKEGLLPALLPFIVQNDNFFDYAVKHSAGGLSPRVKFKDLANYEFLLPPKEQQAKLAELLWAMDEVVEKESVILQSLEIYKSSFDKKKFVLYRKSYKKIGDHTQKIGSGITPKGGSKVYQKTGIKFIRSQNVLSGDFNYDNIVYISEEIDNKMASSRVKKLDVLLNITGASIGRCAIYSNSERANVNQHVCIIRTNKNELDPVFLCEFLNSKYGQVQIQILQAGGNREGLNFSNIRMIKIPNYTIEEQVQIKHDYLLIRKNMKKISNKIVISKTLQKTLINEVF
jgi:type I restriction enzyme S subunit